MDYARSGYELALGGLITAIVFGLAGIAFGSYHILQGVRHKRDINSLGDAVGHDIVELDKAIENQLLTLGKLTLSAIEKNGEVSLRTIEAVHKSIKEELSK